MGFMAAKQALFLATNAPISPTIVYFIVVTPESPEISASMYSRISMLMSSANNCKSSANAAFCTGSLIVLSGCM